MSLPEIKSPPGLLTRVLRRCSCCLQRRACNWHPRAPLRLYAQVHKILGPGNQYVTAAKMLLPEQRGDGRHRHARRPQRGARARHCWGTPARRAQQQFTRVPVGR